MPKNTIEIQEFLRESNAIEGVYDADSFDRAKEAWDFLYSQDALSIGVVLKTHKILMLNQRLAPNEKGYFRTIPVYVGTKQMLHPLKIREQIENWCSMANMLTAEWKNMHIEYERIHPFVDGNGRTGRMFMNWYRLRQGLPLMIIQESDRFEYYKWFA